MKLHGQVATKLALYLAKHADPVKVQAAVERTEGWERNTERGRSNYALVSETQEYNYGKREEMTSDARALCQTFGIASNILGKFANYCVGNGEVTFFTDDTTWDEQAEALIKQQFAIIDPTGEHDMVSMAKLGIISKKRDGDIGFVKTLDSGWPQLQAIEADRIRNDQNMVNVDSSLTQVGGVKLMPNGKPISYRVWERNLWNGFKNPREISARDFILYRNKNRFDGVRGITSFERGALNRCATLRKFSPPNRRLLKPFRSSLFSGPRWREVFVRPASIFSGRRQTAQALFIRRS
jgi:capsid protein